MIYYFSTTELTTGTQIFSPRKKKKGKKEKKGNWMREKRGDEEKGKYVEKKENEKKKFEKSDIWEKWKWE